MRKLLLLTSVAEAATGGALVIAPSVIARLLLGVEPVGVAVPMACVLGIALIALGAACMPGSSPLCGMLTYSVLVTLYLLGIAVRGEWVGVLLWPAAIVHAILALLLLRAWLLAARSPTPPRPQAGGQP